MDDFTYQGKTVEFLPVTGEVISNDKYSETQIRSSGGGGHVGTHGGYVSAPTIHSSNITNHEFWIKTPEGLEIDITFRGFDIPLRVGQKVTVIAAGIKGRGNGFPSLFVNHSAGRHWFLLSANELNDKLRLEVVTGKSLFNTTIIALVIGFVPVALVPNLEVLSLGVAAAFVLYKIAMKMIKASDLNKLLDKHLENIALSSYEINASRKSVEIQT